MRRLFLLFYISCLVGTASPQELQLKDCVRECLQYNALNPNKELAMQIAAAKRAIIRAAWFPTLDLNGQATWQSDVVALNLNLPFPVDFPQIPRDQYKVTADITQLIYDGGSLKRQQVLEDINAGLSIAELEVKDFDLKQSVEDLYFAILVAEKRLEMNRLMKESVAASMSQLESGIRNGVISESELPVLKAEMIRIGQQEISLKSLRQRAIATLSLLMGKEIGPDARFAVPPVLEGGEGSGSRPELKLFDLQLKMTDARKKLLDAQLMPKFMAFGQAGYGKPGLNFLGDKWDPYVMVGVRGTWNVWDWGKIKNQKASLTLNRSVIENQQTAFLRQQSQAEVRQRNTIGEITNLLASDDELILNREQVTAAYNNRLNGGLVTASQYLAEWTREQDARISREVRKIELISSQYKLLNIQGKE